VCQSGAAHGVVGAGGPNDAASSVASRVAAANGSQMRSTRRVAKVAYGVGCSSARDSTKPLSTKNKMIGSRPSAMTFNGENRSARQPQAVCGTTSPSSHV
jgi:hypothetical protein